MLKVSIKSKNLKVLMLLFVVWAKVNLVLQIKKNLKIGKKCLTKFFTTTNIIENTKKYLEKSKGKIICISSICGNELIKGSPITYSTLRLH